MTDVRNTQLVAEAWVAPDGSTSVLKVGQVAAEAWVAKDSVDTQIITTQLVVEAWVASLIETNCTIEQTFPAFQQEALALEGYSISIAQTFPAFTQRVRARGVLETVIKSARGIYLVELYPYNRATTDIDELDYSDAGYVSPPGGIKEHRYFEGRVTQPVHLSRSIQVAPEASRAIALEIGGIEIINTDGVFDGYLLNYSIDGRQVIVKVGLKEWRYDQFVTLFQGRVVNWKSDLSRLDVTAKAEGHKLNIPLQTISYGGTGGADGTPELAGKPKPLTYGICRNIAPPLIDPAYLVYQFHVELGAAVDAVYDRAAALSFTADYFDYAALIAASLSVGEYATCLEWGLFRIGSVPSGLVTADVRGETVYGYIDDTFAIAKRILTQFVGLVDADLDITAFDDMAARVPGPIGWYRSTELINADEALTQIVGHCGAYWGAVPQTGQITVGRLEAPDPLNVSLDIQSYDVLDIALVDPPPNVMPPRFRQRVGYKRNWTIQRGEDLAAIVTADRRQELVQPYSVASTTNGTTQTNFLLAQDPPILESLFDEESDAQEEADRLSDMLSGPSQCVEIRMGFYGEMVELNKTVSLTHPRINGGTIWYARVIGQDIDAGNQVITVTLWGPT